jgi:hypothetical protein
MKVRLLENKVTPLTSNKRQREMRSLIEIVPYNTIRD